MTNLIKSKMINLIKYPVGYKPNRGSMTACRVLIPVADGGYFVRAINDICDTRVFYHLFGHLRQENDFGSIGEGKIKKYDGDFIKDCNIRFGFNVIVSVFENMDYVKRCVDLLSFDGEIVFSIPYDSKVSNKMIEKKLSKMFNNEGKMTHIEKCNDMIIIRYSKNFCEFYKIN